MVAALDELGTPELAEAAAVFDQYRQHYGPTSSRESDSNVLIEHAGQRWQAQAHLRHSRPARVWTRLAKPAEVTPGESRGASGSGRDVWRAPSARRLSQAESCAPPDAPTGEK